MTRLDHREIVVQLEEFLSILFPQDSRVIYLFDPDGLRLHSISSEYKVSKQAGDLISMSDLLDNITQSNHPVIMSDNSNEEIWDTWGIHKETRTWMAAPMKVFDRNIGCITLENRQIDAYNENAIKLVQALANEAAIALENARLFKELELLSTIDPLTGLHNRRHFNAAAVLEFERSTRYDLPLSAIMMDIDHFKNVNDTYGHATGDEVLVRLAALCKKSVRLTDIVARFGGEEFCFLLPQTTLIPARDLAERLRAALAELRFESGTGEFTVTASFGVSNRLNSNDSLKNLLDRSDQALYEAKGTGRNKVVEWNHP